MKRTMLAIMAVIAICGCSRDAVPTKINVQINEVAQGVSRPCKKWGGQVGELLADIKALPDSRQKVECLRRLTDKVLETDLSAPEMENPRSTASAIKSLCNHNVISGLQICGGSIDDAWDVYIALLSWLRTQADKLYGDGKLPKGIIRHKNGGLVILDIEAERRYDKRESAYNMVVPGYDELLNRIECRFPDLLDFNVADDKIPQLKEKLEKFLGRPMRTKKQCREDWYARKSDFPKWPGRQAPLKKPKESPSVEVEVEIRNGELDGATNGTVTVRKFGNEAVREASEDTSQGGGL